MMVQGPGRGAAWLARIVRDDEAGGSNPLAPTKTKDKIDLWLTKPVFMRLSRASAP